MVFSHPKFPNFEHQDGIADFFGFLVSILVWCLLTFFFLIALYTNFFTRNLAYLLSVIKPKAYNIPFWFSLLCVVFFFPLTFGVVVIGTFTRIVRE